jgi:thiamine-phosphate pyrophosphorylase
MRAAALARLARRRLVALGGMDARRYAKIARLGFSGWAGIDAYVH